MYFTIYLRKKNMVFKKKAGFCKYSFLADLKLDTRKVSKFISFHQQQP